MTTLIVYNMWKSHPSTPSLACCVVKRHMLFTTVTKLHTVILLRLWFHIIARTYAKHGKGLPFPKLRPCVIFEEDVRGWISVLVVHDGSVWQTWSLLRNRSSYNCRRWYILWFNYLWCTTYIPSLRAFWGGSEFLVHLTWNYPPVNNKKEQLTCQTSTVRTVKLPRHMHQCLISR